MRVKDIKPEDFVNYKLPSMFIATCFCDYKCCKEQDLDIGVCQNAPLDKEPIKEVDNATILKMYQSNPITKAIVIGGKEPLMQWQEVMDLIKYFRDREEHCPFVIYTGYNADEIPYGLDWLRMYDNTIVKFGRYIINQKPHYDEVLGVWLASDNQYAEVIS